MPDFPELEAKVDELNVALQAEQQQVADLLAARQATIDQLTVTVADLQELVAAGGTEEQRQLLLDKLNAIKIDLEGTVAP